MVEHADLVNAFDDCVTRLADGETLEDCLRRHPQHAAALRSMLETGLLVRRSAYPPFEVAQAQYRVHMKIAGEAARLNARTAMGGRRWLALVASLLIAFLGVFGGLAIAAENSLPGDSIYPVKRLTEALRLALTNAEDAAFDQRRIDEIRQLLALRREADVTFEGTFEAMAAEDWVVDGLPVRLTSDTVVAEAVRVSDRVIVEGRTTAEGTLEAQEVILLERGEPPPSPTPPLMTNTPVPVTPMTPTQAPSATSTADVSLTPTQRPTATPSPMLTPTASGCVATQPAGWVRYTVQPGDTLSELSIETSVSLEHLIEVNCIEDVRILSVNQVLYLPLIPSTDVPAPPAPVQEATGSGDSTLPQNPPSSTGENSDSGNDDGGDDNGSGNDDDGGSGNDDNDDSSGGNSGPGGGDDDDDHDNSGPGGSGDNSSGGDDD